MEPSLTSITGFSGFVRLDFSCSTSLMRRMDSREMVMMT